MGPERILFCWERWATKSSRTDYSEDMLTQARRKAEIAASHVDFRRQDMRTLDILERPFDAVVCLFDPLATLRRMKISGGFLVMSMPICGMTVFSFSSSGMREQ